MLTRFFKILLMSSFALSYALATSPRAASGAQAVAKKCCCKGGVCHCAILGGDACGLGKTLGEAGHEQELQWTSCPSPQDPPASPELHPRTLHVASVALEPVQARRFMGACFILPSSSFHPVFSPPPELA